MNDDDDRVDALRGEFRRGRVDGLRFIAKLEIRDRPTLDELGRAAHHRADDAYPNAVQPDDCVRRKQRMPCPPVVHVGADVG